MIKKSKAIDIALAAMMIAIVYFSNYISISTGDSGSRLHVANAICLLAGLLFGGVRGALIAGLGSALFDVFTIYAAEAWVTFITKGTMAFVCGFIYNSRQSKISKNTFLFVACIAGALSYIALYLIKSYIQDRWIVPLPLDVIPAKMVVRLISASINGLFAIIVAPLLYGSLYPAIKKAGIWKD